MRKITKVQNSKLKSIQRKRVAAYARVSSGKDAMLHSLSAQVSYYNNYIQRRNDWEFVGVYTDEALTGTKDSRPEFQHLLNDCRTGKIDLVITKAISRFARNTLTLLDTVRELKLLGIDVYFEEQNIHTLSADGELMLTLLASYAQEESRSISENVTWGKKKSMEDGKISLAYKNFLGYEKGEDGLPKIVEEQAKVVRQIYRLFLEGKTYRTIKEMLTAQGIPTPRGKTQWSVSTVISILSNEKYKGDALLQKTYTADFLSKTVRKNNGEVPQYYIENSHPAIIAPETFDLVQSEMKKRRPKQRQLNNNSHFAAKIICGDCGGYYGSKVWYSTSKYRNSIWRCNRKYQDDSRCSTPHIREDELKSLFVKVFNQLLGDKERYITQFEEFLPLLADISELEKALAIQQNKCDELVGRMRRFIDENARQTQDQREYEKRFQEMSAQCNKAEAKITKIKEEILVVHQC